MLEWGVSHDLAQIRRLTFNFPGPESTKAQISWRKVWARKRTS